MATRCLYCGGASWLPFRWLRNQEFCSSKHRQLYRLRLQKVLGDLPASQHQTCDSATDSREPTSRSPATQLGGPAELLGHVLAAPGTLAQAQMAPAIVLHDPTIARELTKVLGLPKGGTTTVWLPPDVFTSNQSFREEQPGVGIAPPTPVPGVRLPVRRLTDTLPAKFENHAQIRRWGLKIRFTV